MFQRIFTTCCPVVAAALILATTQGWAQQQAPSVTNEPADETLDEARSLLPPAEIPQPAEMNQQEGKYQEQEADVPDSQDQQYSAERQELHRAPPEPRSDDARRDDRGDDRDTRSMPPANLGVYMLPNEGPGVLIGNVAAGSAADEAGLRPGDYILSINGEVVAEPAAVSRLIRNMQPGKSVELIIWRDGGEQPITATLGELLPTVMERGNAFGVPREEVGYGPGGVVRTYPYRPGVYQRYYSYYPEWNYYYGYPYSYRYYGTPRVGYYRSPWNEGIRVGPFRYFWR